MNETRKKQNVRYFLYGCMLIAVLNVINCILGIARYGVYGGDYLWIWKEHGCAIRGIDVGFALREKLFVEGVGYLQPSIATVPWGRMLGNLVCPGFLPLNIAFIYGAILYILVISYTWYRVTKELINRNLCDRKYICMFSVLTLLIPFYWLDAIMSFNIGVLCTFLIILAALESERHELFAGFLAAIAMLKPQVAFLFFIVFLLKKRFKTIVASLFWICVSWIVYLFYAGGNPITQMLELVGQSGEDSFGFWWFGFLDFLTALGVNTTIAMMGSMILGIVFTFILSLYIIKRGLGDNLILLYSIPAIFSTGWGYKSLNDWIVLCLPMLMIVFLFKYAGMTVKTIVCSYIYILIMGIKVFSGVFRRLLGYEWLTGVSLDAWFRVMFFVLIIVYIVNRIENSNQQH